MSPRSRREMLLAILTRYRRSSRTGKTAMLGEFCAATGYNRKYAIGLMSRPPDPESQPKRRGRRCRYGPEVVSILIAIWEAAGYPWSVRLKAAMPLWLPWAKKRLAVSKDIVGQLEIISARTIDRRLSAHKKRLGRRIYGRTKPGSLLKHHIPIQTSAWDTDEPGFGEIDLVSHSGNSASGEFLHSLNFTDIASTWVETRVIMGKSQYAVHQALEQMIAALPFTLRGLDSDNGSEFINHHLVRFCAERKIQLTRSRPYKKDDNAHIEQKNWTHVRKLLGWERYDSTAALAAINDLYTNELRWMQNLFLPSVKLLKKTRVGSRLKRLYAAPQTPLDRLTTLRGAQPLKLAQLRKLRDRLDPFELSATLERKLQLIYRLVTPCHAEPRIARPQSTATLGLSR